MLTKDLEQKIECVAVDLRMSEELFSPENEPDLSKVKITFQTKPWIQKEEE